VGDFAGDKSGECLGAFLSNNEGDLFFELSMRWRPALGKLCGLGQG
jgi:hypothetical protein